MNSTKIAVAVAAILVTIALGMAAMRFYLYLQEPVAQQPVAVAPRQPQYAFVPIVNQSFVLNPGEGRIYNIGPNVVTDRTLHIELSSASPVDLGVLNIVSANYPGVVANVGNVSLCHQPQITRLDTDCFVPTNAQPNGRDFAFVLHDSRTPQGVAASIGAALFGSKTALNNESVRNDVTLTLSVRQCVANCGGE